MKTRNTKLSNIVEALYIQDEAGLCVVEANKAVPFDIKRAYYIFNVESAALRGKHAHKKTKQTLFCIRGSVKVNLDNGSEKETVYMNRPNEGLYLDTLMWHEMHSFSKDAVLLVFASEYFEESDYIRDYQEFINYLKTV
ncbi:FdtA/QdtA family cupin domain-containing protein [soil metagenome]